jgi:hypothetical protein
MMRLYAGFVLRIWARHARCRSCSSEPNQSARKSAIQALIQTIKTPEIGIFCFSFVRCVCNFGAPRHFEAALSRMTYLSRSNNLIPMMQSCRRHKLRLRSAEDRGGDFGRLGNVP